MGAVMWLAPAYLFVALISLFVFSALEDDERAQPYTVVLAAIWPVVWAVLLVAYLRAYWHVGRNRVGGLAMPVALGAVFVLAGCASLPPPELQAIHDATMARVPYRYYKGWDTTYVRPGEVSSGNCVKQAFTSFRDLWEAGHTDARMHTCTVVKTGERHAVARVGEWALDGRHPWVMPIGEIGCE